MAPIQFAPFIGDDSYLAIIRPDWLIRPVFFILGLQAFRSRWFTANGCSFPSMGSFIAFIVVLISEQPADDRRHPDDPAVALYRLPFP